MKKIKLFCSLIIFSLIISCGSDNNEVDTDGGIIADFSFTNNENLFEFTNLSEGATSYRWDLGDLSFYCEKENPTFRYTKVGGEIKVTLTAINDQGNEASITKVIIAPEVFDINIAIDGSFDDWQNVAVLYDESESGTGSIQIFPVTEEVTVVCA